MEAMLSLFQTDKIFFRTNEMLMKVNKSMFYISGHIYEGNVTLFFKDSNWKFGQGLRRTKPKLRFNGTLSKKNSKFSYLDDVLQGVVLEDVLRVLVDVADVDVGVGEVEVEVEVEVASSLWGRSWRNFFASCQTWLDSWIK